MGELNKLSDRLGGDGARVRTALKPNSAIPSGMVTSTARKGDKWTKAKPGDVLNLETTEARSGLGSAVVTKVELVPLSDSA